MAVSKENTLQAFEWFKNLMDENIQDALSTITSGETYSEFTGATANSSGANGLVPAPARGDDKKYLRGDGTWSDDITKAINQISSLSVAINSLSTSISTIGSGDENVIEAISIDGTIQPVTNKTAALNLSAFAKKTEIAGALSSISSLKLGDENVIEAISIDDNIQPVTNKTAVLNLSSYAKKADIASGIRMKGSVNSYGDLPTDAIAGDLYNIKTAGGTDSDGTPILAGDNVVYTDKGTWDVMAGFIDTSRFVEKVAGKQLSTNDFTNADKSKLASLTNYTLPTASETEKGGIMIGTGLSMAGDVLNVTLEPGNNYTLPTASDTEKGGIKIGDGLQMDGDTLNVTLDSGETYDDFVGATSLKAGANGLVPAPKIGEQTRFLRGDGTWNVIPNSNSVLLVPVIDAEKHAVADVASIQGGLWQDKIGGTPVLKLRYGDYEYNFNYDTLNLASGATSTLNTDFAGLQYTLGTTTSTVDGALWYEVADNKPTLMLHRGSYDYGFNYDTITYKGSNANLYSYLPFESSPTADAFKNMTWSGTGTVVESPFGGYALTNTGSINSNSNSNGHTSTVFTIDFWFSVNKATLPSNNEAYTFLKLTRPRHAGSATYIYVWLQILNKQLVVKTTCSNTAAFSGSSTTHDLPDGRMHIALTKSSTTAQLKVYFNGRHAVNVKNPTKEIPNLNTVQQIDIFQSFASTYPAYIDHFRIFKNQVVWDEDFDPPSADAYF